VVDPETGQVHGVIVGTIDTYNARGGKIGTSYMGCSADCVLRFQTRATSDGNVAGWHGSNVRYNESDQTFDIGSSNGSTSTTQKLVPEKTAGDAAGMDLSTGFVSRVDTLSTDEVRSRVSQDFVNDSNDSVTVNYLSWGVEGTTFRHSTLVEALTNHESDVESVLELQFPAPISEPVEDPLAIPVESENGEEPAERVVEDLEPQSSVDEENPVVQTIRRITETVMEFFRNIAGISSDADQLQQPAAPFLSKSPREWSRNRFFRDFST
jgi:hypothetical protein